MMRRSIIIFSAKAAILSVLVYLLLLVGNHALTHDGTWRKYQNPRTRLLWDRIKDNERIVLLGDSVFTSVYTESASETIWGRIESLLNMPVFIGALDGAKESDILLAARLISQQGRGRVVIVDLVPSRFLRTNEPEKRGGNFNKEIEGKLVTSFFDDLSVRLFGNMPILDKQVLSNSIKKQKSSKGKYESNFCWRNDSRLADERMATLVQMYRENDNVKPFEFVVRLNGIIEETGNKALFVLTPLNMGLLEWYAAQGQRNFIPIFDTIHASLIKYLDRNKIRYLDLYDGPDDNCFVDAIHTNTCGDLFVATRIADYVTATGMLK
jgi:hypothetical protein